MSMGQFRMAQDKTLKRSVSDIMASNPGSREPQFVTRVLMKAGLHDRAFVSAFYVAFPNALITLCCRLLASEGLLPWVHAEADDPRLITVHTAVWTSIVGGLSFLLVFRASQAYTRFWQAITSVHLLQIEWLDACGSLFAFCATSPAPRNSVQNFKHLIVRLFSIYHAAALLRLAEPGVDDDAIADITTLDPGSLDERTTKAFIESPHRLELVGQWIQVAIMHGIQDTVVIAPAPLVSRCFQEIANGNVRFQDALKVKSIPFPPTYQLVCDLLLLMHFIATPFFTSLWVNSPTLSAMLAFFAVFVFWSLNFVARSIENPFCTHHFIQELALMQDDMNSRLLTLLGPIASEKPSIPSVTEEAIDTSAIQKVTLETFWATVVQHKTSTPSHIATLATEASRVNFGSRSLPMQVVKTARRSSRILDSDMDVRHTATAHSQVSARLNESEGGEQGRSQSSPGTLACDIPALTSEGSLPMLHRETSRVSAAVHASIGDSACDDAASGINSTCSERDTLNGQRNEGGAQTSAESSSLGIRLPAHMFGQPVSVRFAM